MKPETIALFAGFFGAILGAAVSVVTILIQQHYQTRREESRLALDAAVKEFSSAEDYAKFMAQNGQRIVTRDLPFYVILHSRIIPLLRKKTISQQKFLTAHKEALELSRSVQKFYTADLLADTHIGTWKDRGSEDPAQPDDFLAAVKKASETEADCSP